MDNKITSLHSTFSVNGEISNDDTRFLHITVDVMHTGKNLNNSFFEKEVVDACIDSIKNTPILGYIKYDKKTNDIDFKGHEHILTRTEDGIEEKYIGHAYGVIPESCDARWVSKMCSDGQEREFLQVDALLWEKFSDATSILYRDVEKAQSMELEISSVEGYEDEDGVFHFEKFRFDGCCLLGSGIDPAMVDANATIKEVQFAMSDFAKCIQSELNDKYIAFTNLVNEKTNDGGIKEMERTDFAQTVLSQFQDIANMVAQHETFVDRWGWECSRYYAVDIQDSEVIVVDVKDNYNYYGVSFTIDGDKPILDFSKCNRKKICYEDYVDGTVVPEGAFDFGKHISEIEENAFSKIEEVNGKVSEFEEKISEFETKVSEIEEAKTEVETNYNQIKADYDEIKPKYDEYVQAEEQRQIEELNAQKDAKFAEYEDVLSENVDFAALKERKDEMSVDEIEKECAVLYVKANRSKPNFSRIGSSAIVGVIEDGSDMAGFVMTKYGNIPVKK